MRALVIDDSKAVRSIIGKIMRELGFGEVVEAGNGLEALERLKEKGKPQIALVDWNMPEMNGYEFVCAVRADSAYDDVPLMMITTETEMDKVMTALEAGANEYVMKPFTKDVLREKLIILGLQA